MIRDTYRLHLAAVPPEGRCLVLELEPWQQEELDDLARNFLTERQWRALDEAVIQGLTENLIKEATHHLEGT